MECRIGEISEYNGEWYQCIAGNGCENCAFYERKCYTVVDNGLSIGACRADGRKDNKDVIFKKLEKVGEPYKFGRKLMQKYNIYAKPYLSDDYGYIYIPGRYNEVISIEIKQNKENMEEQHSTENYPKEDEVATRIANKVGKDIRDQFERNIKMHDTKDDIPEFDRVVDECLFGKGKPNLKPFNLEQAKAGKPVCTRDGRKARIVCFDAEGNKPLIVLSKIDGKEVILRYTEKGQSDNFHSPTPREDDLMMLPEKKEGWILLRKDGYMFDNEEVAKKNCTDEQFVAKVEWEE